jgi:hypothetical protein
MTKAAARRPTARDPAETAYLFDTAAFWVGAGASDGGEAIDVGGVAGRGGEE